MDKCDRCGDISNGMHLFDCPFVGNSASEEAANRVHRCPYCEVEGRTKASVAAHIRICHPSKIRRTESGREYLHPSGMRR